MNIHDHKVITAAKVAEQDYWLLRIPNGIKGETEVEEFTSAEDVRTRIRELHQEGNAPRKVLWANYDEGLSRDVTHEFARCVFYEMYGIPEPMDRDIPDFVEDSIDVDSECVEVPIQAAIDDRHSNELTTMWSE